MKDCEAGLGLQTVGEPRRFWILSGMHEEGGRRKDLGKANMKSLAQPAAPESFNECVSVSTKGADTLLSVPVPQELSFGNVFFQGCLKKDSSFASKVRGLERMLRVRARPLDATEPVGIEVNGGRNQGYSAVRGSVKKDAVATNNPVRHKEDCAVTDGQDKAPTRALQ